MKRPYFVRTSILAGSLLLQLNTFCLESRGAVGDVDLSFDPGSGVNGPVNAVVLQSDGKLVIGGQFTTVRGLSRTNIARLNADGSLDGTFEADIGVRPGADSDDVEVISAMGLTPDGKLIIGESFRNHQWPEPLRPGAAGRGG